MSWKIEVDGTVLPVQLAGHPALELCNTYAGWREPWVLTGDYLKTLDHVAVLARVASVISAERTDAVRRLAAAEPEAAAAEVDRARSLRADLYWTVLGEASAATFDRLADAVGTARSREALTRADGAVKWELAGEPALSDPLDALLVSAADLLTDGARIGVCPGIDCGWLFLNATGRRRWCTMAVCGNRAKQAAHQSRSRSSDRALPPDGGH